MKKQAVILAGGFGKRLSHIVKNVPKPMANIGNVPFIDYLINLLKENGFNSFVILTGYKSEVIENHFKNDNNTICVKETSPLGTGGALLNAYDKLENEFFVLNGDTYFDIDFSLIENFSKDKQATIVLRYSNEINRYGFVEITNDFQVKNFIEKTELPQNRIDGYINAGIYYFKKECLKEFANRKKERFFSIESEIFPQLSQNGTLYGLPLGGCFIDIGIEEDYQKAQVIIPERIKKQKKPALFIDKDGTLIVNTEYPHGKNFEIIEETIPIIKKYYDKKYHIIMVTNQAGIAKGKFNHQQMNECLTGICDFYKKLGILFDGVEYCPYHKDGIIKDYTFSSLLRKPEAGMILRACEKFKIDLKNSVMIGDNKEIDKINLPYLQCKIIGVDL